ncbi:flap endonuclease-1 [Saprolegnia diclina VS20]|uniref:Flap endonuclease 1 n=1 Tax=Saprolegnia diclina (strain VS20) TaxID=1156394 RepID=T0QJW2_SAPDV|nr:flap endonuclease-1 [Saprolegnia diclina VS20]EQC38324.1 flap endonuclease-1 [Saprolegnia diclina VS20]|eukprot:XP_008607916.1 flap endonuclease-1 [Saprolegnia diclina VS20]
MGIKGLMKLLTDEAPSCVKEMQMSQLSGRSVAIDASMALYQFLIAVRSTGDGGGAAQLTNEAGEVTSHIQGMFNRTIRLMEHGVKPVYVFDGKPPVMKSGELAKRTERRQEAQANLKTATEEGNQDDIDKFTKRLVRATPQHSEDCKELLGLMGVPFITAPCEAEATCAALAKAKKVFAAGTEDMDVVTFGTPVLFRRLTIAASRKLPILEIRLEKVLEELNLTYDQFVDLCILCGCDYCDTIFGIGPKKALNAIKEHKTIENFIAHLEKHPSKGVTVPQDWLGEDAIYKQARGMFIEAEVADVSEIDFKWKDPSVDELRAFLVEKHGFNAERVLNGIEKLKKAKTSHSQQRLESFFTVLPSAGAKRKTTDDKKGKGKAAPAKGAPSKRGRKK